MGTRNWKEPTKVQAGFMGVLTLLFLTSNLLAVLVEGRPATTFYWVTQAMNLALLALSLWWFRRAAKSRPTPS
jgi:hypothetical protein